jgi:hypothetical protein
LQGALSVAEEQRGEADRRREEAEQLREAVEAGFRRQAETIDDLLVKVYGRLARMEGTESVR